ncbi:family 43 glycosylhydrolase [Saccharothrix lopnurensis]|uniref:Family 43 glycosylhydrolase n=1 Tax=Saccharothrix lopnurensis TaxID=1670621 RepID=A0ABW1PBP8_9PSEU
MTPGRLGVEACVPRRGPGRPLGAPTGLWSGAPGAKAPEAPHPHKVGDHWYLLIAEGGTERGHAVSIARGRSVDGPFEPCPDNPVPTHRGTDHPVQNTGHADLVQAPDGAWWMVLLGVRPLGGTPGRLTLRADGGSLDDLDVTFVGRRQQHLSCRARAVIDASEGSGGLAVRLDERRTTRSRWPTRW